MIIDAHCHAFPVVGSGEHGELTLKFLHYHIRRKHRPLWRKDDNTRVDEPLLDGPTDDLNDLPDVNFRIGDHGRVEFTVDGVDYYRQTWPQLRTMSWSPEQMIAWMDMTGVDIGVLQHDHIYGALNEYYGDCMRRFPGRFIGLAQIREWEGDREEQHEVLERAILEHGNGGLYYHYEGLGMTNYADHIDDAKFEPLWDKIRELGIPVWFVLPTCEADRVPVYLGHVAELDRWAAAHPDIPAVLTHGIGTLGFGSGEERYQIPDKILTLLRRPNMHIEAIFVFKFPEYPFPDAQEVIRRLRDEVGAEKLMVGCDMPFLWFTCTYRQALDYVRLHCDFLSQAEKDLMLGGNVARMFGIQQSE